MRLETLRGRRVLVTGANGFTGAHLVRALLETGCQVRGLVRRPKAMPEDLRGQVELAAGDVRDAQAVDRAVAGCEIAFHVAALYRDTSASGREYWAVNVGGTEQVLAACERHRVQRLVHCSTVGVHGHVRQVPADETAPIRPTDAYQRSKAAGEARVWAWFRRTGIPTTVVRPAGIYGPGDDRFLKLFQSIQRGRFVMLGSGRLFFHMSYIENLVQGYLRCATEPAAIGEAFIIADAEPVLLNDLVARVAGVVGGRVPRWHLPVGPFYAAGAVCEVLCVPFGLKPPLHRRRVGFFTHERAFSIAKAQRLLGYAPAVSLAEGLQRTAAWYQTHGDLRPTNGALHGARP
jgi:nucleoside-diphosphate-sugar epimerase